MDSVFYAYEWKLPIYKNICERRNDKVDDY